MTKKKTEEKTIALLDMVDYEKAVPLELKHPQTGVGLGVIIRIKSGWSDAVKTASRKAAISGVFAADDGMEERQIKTEAFTLARVAACIDSWDLGDKYHLFEGQTGNVECNEENRLALVKCPWIFSQINEKYENIGNFMKA